jgi:hypothetical protein
MATTNAIDFLLIAASSLWFHLEWMDGEKVMNIYKLYALEDMKIGKLA